MPEISVITEGASLAELQVNRVNTTAFIRANPSLVILYPRSRDQFGDGYSWSTGDPRPGQMMRVIDQSSTGDPAGGPAPGDVKATDGIDTPVPQTDFFLLGEWDADIAVYDWWTDTAGRQWEVLDVFPPNGYEIRAVVAPIMAFANAIMQLERGSGVTSDYLDVEDIRTALAINIQAFIRSTAVEAAQGSGTDETVTAQIQVGPIVDDDGGLVIPVSGDRLSNQLSGEIWTIQAVNRSRLPGGRILIDAERTVS